MKTWAQLLSENSAVPQPLVQWWLSDFLDCSLTEIPLQATPRPAAVQKYHKALSRLAEGEPVQYVCGRAPFRDLELKVDPRVLIPRPETEQLVQIALDRFIHPGDRVLDIGTGSGCMALSIKKARPDCQVKARDLSRDAIDLAKENAELLELDVEFKQADLLGSEPQRSAEVILANLPYIGEKEKADLPAEVREFEPHLALFSGPEGTDLILQLLGQAADVLVPGGHLLLETGENQGGVWRQAAAAGGWKLESQSDLAGRERFWFFQRSC